MDDPQPATSILGYGSLLNLDSLRSTVPRCGRAGLEPVRVTGFERRFRLVSLSRGEPHAPLGSGQRLAVLDVVPRAGARLGALRIDVPASHLADLDQREGIYDCVDDVPWRGFYEPSRRGRASIYRASPAPTLRDRDPARYAARIEPLGADGLASERILPADDYLRLCIEGAYSWGRAFGDDFVATTRLGDGRPLAAYGPAVEAVRRIRRP